MKTSKKQRAIAICKMVAEDAEKDVSFYEGKPFNGRNVSEHNGKQAACIVALANLLQSILEEDDNNVLLRERQMPLPFP